MPSTRVLYRKKRLMIRRLKQLRKIRPHLEAQWGHKPLAIFDKSPRISQGAKCNSTVGSRSWKQ